MHDIRLYDLHYQLYCYRDADKMSAGGKRLLRCNTGLYARKLGPRIEIEKSSF